MLLTYGISADDGREAVWCLANSVLRQDQRQVRGLKDLLHEEGFYGSGLFTAVGQG